MKKKIIGLITTFLILFNAFYCYSIVGENVNKIEKLDDYDVNVSCENNSMTVYPFETAVYGVLITNTGNLVDTYILDCPDLIDCCYWSSLSIEEITLNPGKSGIVVLSVEPYFIEEATYTITVRATSTGDPMVNDSVPTFTTVILGDRVIDVSTNKPFYNPGEPVVLSLTNIADVAIEGNPTLEVFNEDHELVYGCYPDCWITLMPGESFNHTWIPNITMGKYTVEGIFLTYEEEYFDDESFFMLDKNLPPNPPIIMGPTHGRVFVEYEYTFVITDDSEGDPISLRVDWGIGGPGKLYGPFPPGTHVKLKYKWRRIGTFIIRAQTSDPYGESEWATFKVTMPRNKATINSLLLLFLERFPLLKRLF